MRTRGLAALAAFLVFGVCATARGEGQFPLKKIAISGQPPLVAMYAQRFLEREQRKPSTVKSVPKLSANAAYYIAEFGDKKVVMLFDSGSEYKLYVDTDLDGDLAEETPFTSARQAQKRSMLEILTGGGGASPSQPAKFGPLSLPLGDGGAEVEFNVQVMNQYGYAYLFPASYRSGQVEIDGKGYEVNLIDSSYDGRYDSAFAAGSPFGADWFAIDLDRNGRMMESRSGPSEVIPLPRMVRVGDAYYSLDVVPDGSAIRVAEVQPKYGAIDLASKDLSLTLWSDSGCHVLTGAEKPQQVPAGRYRTMAIVLSGKDDKGVTWTCQSAGDTGSLSDFQLAAGETREIKAGEPLRPNISISGPPGTAYFAFSLTGQAGEQYAAGAERNGRRQGAPTFKVTDEAGKVLLSAAFEYG
jgi:hypothetical protein